MGRQLSVRIPDELDGKIRHIAEELRLKKSDVVRLALERLAEEFREGGESRPIEKVKHLIGSVKTGVSDLGTEHRKHLLRKFRKHA